MAVNVLGMRIVYCQAQIARSNGMADQRDKVWIEQVRNRRDHREFVGPGDEYDVNAAMQFNLLTVLGLREYHKVLDIGCGSLRAGRLLIVYLLPGHYFGIEPEPWIVESAIEHEIGGDLIELKSPSFSHNSDFLCDRFNQEFDYILAQGVFTHAPTWQIRKCLLEVTKCMKSSSIFAASYMQGDENYEGDEWLYPRTSFYTPGRMREMVSSVGLISFPVDWPHPRGAKWILLCKTENESKVLKLVEKANEFHLHEKLDELQMKVYETEQALARLRAHPYVKIGMKINQLLRRLCPSK